MANEITATVGLTGAKGGLSISQSWSKQFTMAGDDMLQGSQVINNADAEALTFGEIAGVPAYIIIKNLDAANFVEFATDEPMANKFAKLLAGHAMGFPPSSATIYAQASTAPVRVAIVAVEA